MHPKTRVLFRVNDSTHSDVTPVYKFQYRATYKSLHYRLVQECWLFVAMQTNCDLNVAHCRMLLPQPWRGLEEEQLLYDESGVRDSLSVHRGGHIGFGRTLESVLEMARKPVLSTRW